MIYVTFYLVIGSILTYATWDMLKEGAAEHDLTLPLDLALIGIVAIVLWPLFSLSTALRNWDHE